MVPEIVGRYELLRPLGAGGMGEVFLARDQTLNRQVAVKRVHAGDEKAAKYILHEARVIASLDHPNIASVYDIVEHHGDPHIIMEYVDGVTLSSRMAAGPLGERQVVDYGRQIAGALAYAHSRNVLHCDVKPGNVMITADGVPKVLDFGIARRDSHTTADATTSTNVIQGTPPYMAPEVLLGSPPSQQSDVFGLGVMLYELVSGKRPYEGRGAAAVLTAMTMPPPALETGPAGVSPALSTIVARAIHTDRKQRLQSAQELKVALDRIASSETMTLPPAPVPVPVPVPARSFGSPKAMALMVSLALVCAALVAGVPRLTDVGTKQSVLGVMIFNTTGDAENDYLAAGMADVLVSHVADAPGVTVVPRTAMPSLTRESQVQEAVKALGLTHVLTGSVQRAGSSVRIAVSLLVEKGASVKWSRTFDGNLGDVFHLEQRAGQAALHALRAAGLVTVSPSTQVRSHPGTTNEDAFDSFAHGRALIERFDVPGNVDRARTFFERAIEQDPSFGRAHAALGDVCWRKYTETRDTAWIDRARAAMLRAIRLAADEPEVLYTMALIDRGTGQIDDAIAGLEKLLDTRPTFDAAHRLLARIYSDRGDFDRAITELREAQAIRPDYPGTLRELGLAYFDKGRYDEAIASFTKLTTLQPDAAPAYQLLGTAYHAVNELERALVAYHQANSIAPRATTYSNIGTIHYARREYRAAIAAYREAIALQPKEPTTHRNVADALLLIGDRSAAYDEYENAITLGEAALKVNPKATRTRSLIAYCHAKLGRTEQAREMIAEVVKGAPDDNDAAYKQAVVAALAGRSADALQYLERAVTLGYSRAMAESDRDLDRVRSLPAFSQLLSR